MSELTPLEMSFSPSRSVPNAELPEMALQKWAEFQQKCFQENLKNYNVDLDVPYGCKLSGV
jgi:hypothetical protein